MKKLWIVWAVIAMAVAALLLRDLREGRVPVQLSAEVDNPGDDTTAGRAQVVFSSHRGLASCVRVHLAEHVVGSRVYAAAGAPSLAKLYSIEGQTFLASSVVIVNLESDDSIINTVISSVMGAEALSMSTPEVLRQLALISVEESVPMQSASNTRHPNQRQMSYEVACPLGVEPDRFRVADVYSMAWVLKGGKLDRVHLLGPGLSSTIPAGAVDNGVVGRVIKCLTGERQSKSFQIGLFKTEEGLASLIKELGRLCHPALDGAEVATRLETSANSLVGRVIKHSAAGETARPNGMMAKEAFLHACHSPEPDPQVSRVAFLALHRLLRYELRFHYLAALNVGIRLSGSDCASFHIVGVVSDERLFNALAVIKTAKRDNFAGQRVIDNVELVCSSPVNDLYCGEKVKARAIGTAIRTLSVIEDGEAA